MTTRITILLSFLLSSIYMRGEVAPPANDNKFDPIQIKHSLLPTCLSGTTRDATGSQFSAICGFPNDDVWYNFVASKADIEIKVTGIGDFTPAFELYDQQQGGRPLTCIGPVGNIATFTSGTLTVGRTYEIRLFHSQEAAANTPDFEICISGGAPIPTNDDCSSATVLQCGIPLNDQSNAGASSNLPANLCSDPRSVVWYQFSTEKFGYATVEISNSTLDYQLSIITSEDCNNYEVEECIFNGFDFNPFTTYYIVVYASDFSSNPIGTFDIEIDCEDRSPPNDEVNHALELRQHTICFNTPGSSINATESFPDCQGGIFGVANDDVWYRFEATADSAIIDADGEGNFFAIMEFYFDYPDNNNPNSQCAGSLPATIRNLTVGSEYYFRLYDDGGFTSPPTSWEFDVCVYGGTAPPANDNCQNAVLVEQKPDKSFNLGNSQNATQSFAGCVGFADDDVWYKFVANSSEALIEIKTNISSGYDPVLAVHDGCDNPTTLLCVDENGTIAGETGYVTNLTEGQTYYYRVYHWWNNGSFDPNNWSFQHTVYGGAPEPCFTFNSDLSNQHILSGEYRSINSISVQSTVGTSFIDSVAQVLFIAPNGIT